MNWLRKILPLVAVVVGAIGVCFRFFGYIIENPGNYIFSSSADGIKNYFTVFYQVLHGQGNHFSGSLYPNGDLLVFADGQPVLTWFLKLFFDSDTPIETLLGTMNLIMIFNVVLCAIFVYLILRKCDLSAWYSVICALIIAFLSPQLDRLGGHYALVYTFFIPAIWYFLLQVMTARSKWLWVGLYCFTVLLLSMNQPYYLIIATALSGSVLAWHAVNSGLIRKERIGSWLALSSALVVPAVVMVVYLAAIDPVTDRPTAPFGIGSYDASFSGTFVPVNGPVSVLIRSYLFRIFDDPAWEARAFVGIPSSLFLLLLIWRTIKGFQSSGFRLFRKRSFPRVVSLSLIPAFLVLAFASGNLHKYGLFLLYDVIPSLKQFRSLGRLAWVFYYIFTVSAATYFYLVFRHLRFRLGERSTHAWVVISLILGVWTVDAISNIKSAKNLIGILPRSEYRMSSSHFQLKDRGLDFSQYQAILPLPFSLVGSEKLMKTGGPWAFSHSVDLSLNTGLPLFGGHMSRTSWMTTQAQSQMVSHPILPKPFLKELENERDILVLWSYEGLTDGEEFVKQNAKDLGGNEHFQIYSISVTDYMAAHEQFRRSVLDSLQSSVEGEFPITSLNTLIGQEIFNDSVLDSSGNSVYEISYWTKIDLSSVGTVKSIGQMAHDDGSSTGFKVVVDGSCDVFGDWIRANSLIQTKKGLNWIILETEFSDGLVTPVHLRNVDSVEYRDTEGLWNNYPIVR